MTTSFARAFSVILLSSFLITAQSQATGWDGYNDPGNMDAHFNYHFSSLPLAAKLTGNKLPWSETFWPAKKGSINIRWGAPGQPGFNYYTPSKSEILRMSRAQLQQLSASEKYDIYMGHYNFPLNTEVAESWANPGESDWAGICDGWSTAAVQYSEPKPVDGINPDGVVVPFGSSDIKALMAFSAAAHFKVETRQVGSRCMKATGRARRRRVFHSSECSDINAGAMHVIMTNMIGLRKKSFVMDRDPGPEIWNQPVLGYKFQQVGEGYSGRGYATVEMRGTIFYTDELDNSMFHPVVGTKDFQEGKLEMSYTLDLDQNGDIVGGDWFDGSDHPDFMWLPMNHLTFTGEMAGVNKLYEPAIK